MEVKPQATMKMSTALAEKSKSKTVQKASFEQIISEQSSDGFWRLPGSHSALATFFGGSIPGNATEHNDVIWHTLLALLILEEEFEDRESEWDLLAVKAKKWLIIQGVTSPMKLLNAME